MEGYSIYENVGMKFSLNWISRSENPNTSLLCDDLASID